MKHIIFIVFAGLLLFVSCERLEETQTANIQYVSTELGGCNLKSEHKRGDDETGKDTVIITVSDDSIRVFVGLNYVCMSIPFGTQCEIINNVITIHIIDNCTEDPGSCYAKCMCYYTFDFLFERTAGNINQKYKILLVNPQKEEPDVIAEGVIKK
jgi:hypothetical protein